MERAGCVIASVVCFRYFRRFFQFPWLWWMGVPRCELDTSWYPRNCPAQSDVPTLCSKGGESIRALEKGASSIPLPSKGARALLEAEQGHGSA